MRCVTSAVNITSKMKFQFPHRQIYMKVHHKVNYADILKMRINLLEV